jgi:diguanylate cyclase (GGDEF)-like protein
MLSYKKEILYPLLAASILVTISTLSLFYTMFQFRQITEQRDLIDIRRYDIITLRNAILDAENSQRGYLLTNNVTFLEHYEGSKIQAIKTMACIMQNTESLPKLSPLILKINELAGDKFNIIEASINVQINAGSYASHLTLSKDHGKAVMDEIRLNLKLADQYLLGSRQALEDKMHRMIKLTLTAAAGLVLMIFAILIFSYRRTLRLFNEMLSTSTKADHLSYQATHDPLTNLYNRRGFEDMLERIHGHAQREKRKYAIFYMDLDGFKAVNDQFSHEVGDQLLVSVSHLFQNFLRDNDCLARLGGDEFTLVVQSFNHKDELTALANRLILALNHPIILNDRPVQVGVSIGVAIYRIDGFKPQELMAAADSAMYKAKKSGKNQVAFLN